MLTNEQLEDLATLHLAPQIDAGEKLDLLPLLRAVEAAERERWEAAARSLVAAHDASLQVIGERMRKQGITTLSIPGDAQAEIAAIAALRALVGPNV